MLFLSKQKKELLSKIEKLKNDVLNLNEQIKEKDNKIYELLEENKVIKLELEKNKPFVISQPKKIKQNFSSQQEKSNSLNFDFSNIDKIRKQSQNTREALFVKEENKGL